VCLIYSRDDVDIAQSKELSAILEITSVLQEWGEIWKQLFVVCIDLIFYLCVNAASVKDSRLLEPL